jgi:glycosyltransferase involved in cell wall biosynthesis
VRTTNFASGGVKIGLVNVGGFVGGAERELVDHAVALRDDPGVGVLAIIDSASSDFAALLRKSGIATETANFQLSRPGGAASNSAANVFAIARQAARLKEIAARHGLDLLITSSFHSGVIAALARITGLKAKLVIGQVTRRDLSRGGFVAEHLQFFAADGVTYNSQSLQTTYRDLAKHYARPERVVYSYVKKPVLTAAAADTRARILAQHGLAPETRLVGYCGHIFEYKRVQDLVEAVGLLNDRTDNYFLIVIGGAAQPAAYERDVRALAQARCAGRHHFYPFSDDPFPLIAACDVLAQPSVEPFGRVIVEAMHLGVPFVATDRGGPREIMALSDPRCGRLAPPARPDLIAEAIVAATAFRSATPPAVPYALSRDGIIGGALQFYRDVLSKTGGTSPAFGMMRRDHAG